MGSGGDGTWGEVEMFGLGLDFGVQGMEWLSA